MANIVSVDTVYEWEANRNYTNNSNKTIPVHKENVSLKLITIFN